MGLSYIPSAGSIVSVNGQQGDVQITPQSIGAVDNDTIVTTHSITGWVEGSEEVNISFNETSRILTVSPIFPITDFFFYSEGIKFVKVGDVTIKIPDITGFYFIYFDKNGVLHQSATSFFSDPSYVFVSIVYWNATQKKAIYVAEETHGQIERNLHLRLHSQGSVYKSGLIAGNYSLVGDGSLNSHAQISISGGEIMDEDILISITHSDSPDGYSHEQIISPILNSPIIYMIGNDFQISDATQFPVKMGTLRTQYNKNTAGVWSLSDVESDDKYIAMWVFATNDVRYPIITMMGQRTDSTLNDAKINNLFSNLSFGADVPFVEFRLLYRLIYKVNSTFNNSVKARLEDILDERNVTAIQISSISVMNHIELNNRSVANSHPASAISYDNISSGLTAIDVNDAIDELQIAKPTKEYVDTSTLDIFSGGTSVPTITGDENTGLLTIGSMTVNAHAVNDFSDNVKKYTMGATTLQLVENQYSYLIINNSSTPSTPFYQIITDNNLINHSNIIAVANVLWENIGNDKDVHIFKVGAYGYGTANKISHRMIHTDRFAYESGLLLSEYPPRCISLTQGKIWYDGTEISLSSILSSVSGVHIYYHENNVWTVNMSVSQYDNYNYDNGNNLVTLSDNHYSVNWIYRDVSDLNGLSLVLGQGDYTLSQAQASQPPSSLPAILSKQHILVGRIIVKKNDIVATQVDTSFGVVFNGSGIIEHNDITNIQGGQPLEYYHLTNTEHTVATQTATTSRNGILTSTDWNIFNNKPNALAYTPEDISNKASTPILGTSDTLYPTQKAVKTYVDTQILNSSQPKDATLTALAGLNSNTGFLVETAPDTFTKRNISGTIGNIVVNNGNGISGDTTINIGADVVTTTGSQALTNKTFNASNNTISNISTTHLASGVLDIDLSSVSANDDTIPSAKATKAYADTKESSLTKGNLTTNTTGLTIGSGSGVVIGSGTQINIATAATGATGLLTSTDWNTFYNKQATITGGATTILSSNLTVSRALLSDANGKVGVSTVTDTELGYLSGVSSAIQTQFGNISTALSGKQATITGGATTVLSSNLTASRALASDSSGKIVISNATDTELNYLSGVTSAIQTQINGKQKIVTYGEMLEDSPSGTSLTLSSAGTFYKWVNSSAGLLSGVTHSAANDELTISTGSAGIYRVVVNICGLYDQTNQLVTVGVYKGANITNLKTYFKTTNASNQSVNATICRFINLADGDTLSLWMSSSSNTDVLTVYNINVNISRIA